MKTSASVERRGWLSPSLSSLVLSALGLSLAGSIGLAATAQGYPGETPSSPPSVTSTLTPGSPNPASPNPASPDPASPTPSNSGQPSETLAVVEAPPDPALVPFVPADGAVQGVAERTPELQAALIKERAAQRAEGLAESAAQASRAAVVASSEARQKQLSKAERARQLAAAKIADENLRKAVAARVAAAAERAAAERAAAERAAAEKAATGRSAPTNSADPPPVSTAPIPSGGKGVAPVTGAVIGAHFGQYGSWSRYHTGLDFRAAYGTPIRAVKAGRVLFAGNSGDWAGNHIAIRHADGMTSMSSHMSSMAVSSGATVQAGQVIGYVGQTGRAFGAHLHFEIYPRGVAYGDVYRAIDPVPWLRANGVTTH